MWCTGWWCCRWWRWWVTKLLVMQPVVLQTVGGTAGDAAVLANGPVLGPRVDPVRVMVVLVVGMVRSLEAMHLVIVPLVRPIMSAGVAMGGGAGGGAGGDGTAGDVTGECAAGDADGEGASD